MSKSNSRRRDRRPRFSALIEAIENRRYCDSDNSFTSAVNLGTVSTYVTATGSVNHSSDAKDYVKFTVPSGSGTFKVKLSGLSNNTDLYLYNSSKSQINSSKSGGTSSETITKTGLSAGTYYAEVRSVSSASNYKLELESDFTADSRTSARNVGALGTSTKSYSEYVGTLDSNDYYKFTTGSTGNVTLRIEGLSGNANLQLLSSGGSTLASSTNSGTTADQIVKSLSAGTYYARVYPSGSSDNAKYTLKLTAGGGGGGSSDPGDSIATAKDIGLVQTATTTITGSVSTTDTGDYYKFVTNSSGVINVNLSGLNADADVQLFDSGGTLVSSSTRGAQEFETILFGAPTGTYYVRVLPYNPTGTVNYTLKLSKTPLPSDQGANTYENATFLSADTSGAAVVNDTIVNRYDANDFYVVYSNEPGTIRASLSGLSADLDVIIYDETFTQVARSGESAATTDSVEYQTLGGYYYIQVTQGVSGGVSTAGSAYRLDLQVPTDGAGNSFGSSMIVSTPFSVTGATVGGAVDSADLYQIAVPDNTYITMDLADATAATNLKFYGSGGELEYTRTTTDGAANLTLFIHLGKTFWVGIDTGSTSTSSTYNLTMITYR